MSINIWKKIFTFLFLSIIFVFSARHVFAQEETFEGKIIRVAEEEGNYQKLEIEVVGGDKKGQVVVVENGMFTNVSYLKYGVNDRVVLTRNVVDGQELIVIADHVRRPMLGLLFGAFVLCVIAIAGRWGLFSLLGLGYSFYIIFTFILPLIIKGYDPVLVSIFGSAFIIPVTFSLSHGLNKKTLSAVFGTFLAMILVGLLSVIFVNLTKLTGFAAEEAGFLQYQLGDLVNLRGILLAGIIIGSLGVMDDITVSQASVVEELRAANKKLKSKELFLRSMKVGKDHIASMVNTLVLVYTGASLPLLLLFVNNPHPFVEIINYEIVAEEIVRTLVGSIGLIIAVPITSFIASYGFKLKTVIK